MKIRHFRIENFRAIGLLEVDCSGGVNVLVGDNGAGKSSVLNALSILFSWLSARLNAPNGRGRQIGRDDIRNDASYCFLSVTVEHLGASYCWSLVKNRPGDRQEITDRITDLSQLRQLGEALQTIRQATGPWPVIYDVNRNISSVSLSTKLFDGKRKNQLPRRSLFSWKAFFNWFYERENEENRMKARFNPSYHDETLDAVRACLPEVFPGYTNLRIEDHPRTRLVIDKQGRALDFEALSDGEKCYIALVLDIARRLSMMDDGTRPPLRGECIVFIDEVDLHLHPSWQLLVLSNLERMFPRCQFIVTSHSPLVLSGLGPQGRLIILGDGKEVAVSDIPYGDNGDYILKRFFGLAAVRNPEVQQKIDAISAEFEKEHPDLYFIEWSLQELSRLGVWFAESPKMHLLLAQKKKSYAQDK